MEGKCIKKFFSRKFPRNEKRVSSLKRNDQVSHRKFKNTKEQQHEISEHQEHREDPKIFQKRTRANHMQRIDLLEQQISQ